MNKIFIWAAFTFSTMSILSGISFGGIKYNQSNKINNDGSVSVSITYSAKTSDVKSGKSLIGNFPFTDKSIRENFQFPGAVISKAISYKDPQDSNNTAVTVVFSATDFSNIINAKALNGIKASISSTDTGLVYSWFVPSIYLTSNFIDTYQFIVNSDPEIRSSNGTKYGESIHWFLYTNKVDPRGNVFKTTVKSNVNMNTAKEESNIDKEGDNKSKKCGLFGLELPFLLLSGLILSRKFKNRK